MNIRQNNIEIAYFENYMKSIPDNHSKKYHEILANIRKILSKFYQLRNKFVQDYQEEYSFVTIKSKMYIQ
jgi:hypothetical protein